MIESIKSQYHDTFEPRFSGGMPLKDQSHQTTNRPKQEHCKRREDGTKHSQESTCQRKTRARTDICQAHIVDQLVNRMNRHLREILARIFAHPAHQRDYLMLTSTVVATHRFCTKRLPRAYYKQKPCSQTRGSPGQKCHPVVQGILFCNYEILSEPPRFLDVAPTVNELCEGFSLKCDAVKPCRRFEIPSNNRRALVLVFTIDVASRSHRSLIPTGDRVPAIGF